MRLTEQWSVDVYPVNIDINVDKDTWAITPILKSPSWEKYHLLVNDSWVLETIKVIQ